MKAYADILAAMAAKLDEGVYDDGELPSLAVDGIKRIKSRLEALYESVIIVETYLNRKDKKDKTR